MAKISEHFLEFNDIPSLNQIPVLFTKDQWYITTGKNSVTKVHDSKSIHTWTLLQGHIHYFTTPVAFFRGTLYSVMDEAVLLKWFDEDKTLENVEKIKLQEEVHSIIQLQKSEPLIVFQSGKFIVTDDKPLCYLKPIEPTKLKNGDFLKWVDATDSVTEIEVFYLIYNNKNKQKTLHYFVINKDDKSVSSTSISDIFHESASFKGCCLNHQDSSFFSLWSDGTLQYYNVKNSSNRVILSVNNVSNDTVIAICCIDSKHLVIAKGSPKSKECLLEIWDIEHAVLRASKSVTTLELISVQISTADGYIFLNLISDKLIAIPYFLDSSFASTLNTSEPKEFQQLTWYKDLEVKQIPLEDEQMDICFYDLSSIDSVEELAAKLLNEDLFDLKFISESELIKILQLVIRYQKDKQIHLNKEIVILLNIIFSAPINDALLMKHLKVLKCEDVLATLDILLKYLKHSVNISVDALQKPSDLQIVNWMCLTISSHTETLLFTKNKDAQKLLKNLKKTLSVKIQEFEDLEGLQSFLLICCSKKDILPQQCSVEKYCLETLDI